MYKLQCYQFIIDVFYILKASYKRRQKLMPAPVNLGGKINTAENEMSPTFIECGILTFASDGREDGFGNLDISYTDFPGIGEIVNMGDKINSEADNFGLVLHPGEKLGYFSSNREGAGSNDIFRFDITSPYYVLKRVVIDNYTNKALPGTDVVLYDCGGIRLHQQKATKTEAFLFM